MDFCRGPGRSDWSRRSGPWWRCGAGLPDSVALHSLSVLPGAKFISAPERRLPTPQLNEQTMWADRRLIDLFNTEFPIVLAPMAGVMDAELVIAAAQGGALGSLPCAMLAVEKAREQVNIIRQRVSAPVNMNFFCHEGADPDPQHEAAWNKRLSSYHDELGLDPAAPVNTATRGPFDSAIW